jgi:hypothetical protein
MESAGRRGAADAVARRSIRAGDYLKYSFGMGPWKAGISANLQRGPSYGPVRFCLDRKTGGQWRNQARAVKPCADFAVQPDSPLGRARDPHGELPDAHHNPHFTSGV